MPDAPPPRSAPPPARSRAFDEAKSTATATSMPRFARPTAHLRRLPALHLLAIKSVLRELLKSDPILVHLVRSVTAPDN